MKARIYLTRKMIADAQAAGAVTIADLARVFGIKGR